MPTIKCPPSAYIMTRLGKAFWGPRARAGPPRPPEYHRRFRPKAPDAFAAGYPRYPKALRDFQRIAMLPPTKNLGPPGEEAKAPSRGGTRQMPERIAGIAEVARAKKIEPSGEALKSPASKARRALTGSRGSRAPALRRSLRPSRDPVVLRVIFIGILLIVLEY